MAIWQYYIRGQITPGEIMKLLTSDLATCSILNHNRPWYGIKHLVAFWLTFIYFEHWGMTYEVRETSWSRGEQLKYNRRHFPSQEDLNFSEIQNKFNYQIPTMTKSFLCSINCNIPEVIVELPAGLSRFYSMGAGITKQNISIIEYSGDSWPFPNHITISYSREHFW